MLGMDNAAVVNADCSDVAFIEGLPGIIEEQFHSADGKSSADKGTEDTNDEVDSGVQNHIEGLAKVPESATAKADNEVTVFLDPAQKGLLWQEDGVDTRLRTRCLGTFAGTVPFHVDAHTETLANARLA